MDIKKILKVYLDKLIHRFLLIRRLDDELNTMTEWLLHKPEGDIALNIGASFFNLVQRSFNLTLLLEICKFIDDDEEKSLRDWLNQAYKNAKALAPTRFSNQTWKRELVNIKEYQKFVAEHLALLDSHIDIIKKLKTRRDKAIAHTDSSFFNNPDDHFEKYPLPKEDIKTLIELISSILRLQAVFIFESDYDLSTVHTVNNLNRVLQFVQGFERAQKDKQLQEKGVYVMRYKWDEVINPIKTTE